MKRRLLLISLYGLFGLLAFLFFVWLTFPWDRVQTTVERRIEAATGYEVSMQSFGSYWFTGVEAEQVVLTRPLTPAQKEARKAAREIERQRAAAKKGEGEDKDAAAAGKAKPAAAGDEEAGAEGEGDAAGDGKSDGAAAATEGPKLSEEQAAALASIEPPIRMERVAARLALLPLLRGRLALDFVLDLAGGHMEGRAAKGGQGVFLELEATDLRLAALPLLARKVPLPLKGVLSLEGEVAFYPEAMEDTEGRLRLDLKGLELGAGEVPLPKGAMFPTFELETPTALGQLELELVMGEEQARDPKSALLHVQRFEHQGKDVEFKLEGDIVLAAKPMKSRPDLTLGVHLTPPFINRNHLGVLVNARQVKRYMAEEFLGVTLRGSFEHPEPRLAVPVWGKPRTHLRAVPGARKDTDEASADDGEDAKPSARSTGSRGRPVVRQPLRRSATPGATDGDEEEQE